MVPVRETGPSRLLAAEILGGRLALTEMEARAEWHEAFTRVYRGALDLGDPGDNALLADLQDRPGTASPWPI